MMLTPKASEQPNSQGSQYWAWHSRPLLFHFIPWVPISPLAMLQQVKGPEEEGTCTENEPDSEPHPSTLTTAQVHVVGRQDRSV